MKFLLLAQAQRLLARRGRIAQEKNLEAICAVRSAERRPNAGMPIALRAWPIDQAAKAVRDGAEYAIALPVRDSSESKARTTYDHAAAMS
jgi:hypothetical protein